MCVVTTTTTAAILPYKEIKDFMSIKLFAVFHVSRSMIYDF
jgi:hypothetical protein